MVHDMPSGEQQSLVLGLQAQGEQQSLLSAQVSGPPMVNPRFTPQFVR